MEEVNFGLNALLRFAMSGVWNVIIATVKPDKVTEKRPEQMDERKEAGGGRAEEEEREREGRK